MILFILLLSLSIISATKKKDWFLAQYSRRRFLFQSVLLCFILTHKYNYIYRKKEQEEQEEEEAWVFFWRRERERV